MHSRILLPFAAGYFSYLFHHHAVLPSDRANHLAADDLGLLTAAYFITFGVAQLPPGCCWTGTDCAGGSRSLCIAAFGAISHLALGESPQLIVGRGLIDFGVSACLMAAFKAFTQWLNPAGCC